MPRLFVSAGVPSLVAALLLSSSSPSGPLRPAAGHAVMIEPRGRPWMEYLVNYNYLPHQVFAGGTKAISQDETLVYPAMHKSGVCGDAFGESHWSKPGPVMTNYTSGAAIDVDIIFAQNHLGRYEVRLCPLDAQDEATDCQPLQRVDGKGPAVYLPMTPGWHGATAGFVAPEGDGAGDEGISLYQMPTTGRDKGCAAWACDQFKDMWVYRTQWRLPADYTCEHCMLQFYYVTGSRCWPPCLPDSKDCIENPMEYGICGEKGEAYPEMFFNCADITISAPAPERKQRSLRG